jgi:hypothetical protein
MGLGVVIFSDDVSNCAEQLFGWVLCTTTAAAGAEILESIYLHAAFS